MSASDILRAERAALCDTFTDLGPDVPTLCEGWTAADLAAHLVVREHRPDALAGIIVGGPLAAHTNALMEREKHKGFDAMVARLRRLPFPFGPGPAAAANVPENWIHHEDLRRANGLGPRAADPEVDALFWRVLSLTARPSTRKLRAVGLELDDDHGNRRLVRRAEPLVVLRGAPGELALYLAGRKDAAQVELMGPMEAQDALRNANLGL